MPDPKVVKLLPQDAALENEVRIATRLVRAIRGGDPGAETEMIERYSRGLGYLLALKSGDRERARDLLHDTFCIALEKLRTTDIENPERLAGYLRGIAIRVALNAGRKRDREPLPMENDVVQAMPDNVLTQFQQIDGEQRAAAIQELLNELKVPRDRELLMRFYVYDQDKAEICNALRLDSLHFNRVLFRAKQRFRKILEESNRAVDLAGSVDE